MPSSHTPCRIACLQPSATVILEAIGELGRVVACTRYCVDVVPEVSDGSRTILADSWTAEAQEIARVQPDLVIAAVPYQEKAVGEILKAGARFLGLAPKSLADVYTDIATIAGVVGASEQGHAVIADMQRRIEQARVRTAGAIRPRVFCEEWGKPIIASQKWVAELVEAAGGEFAETPGRSVTTGEILRLDPEVVIAGLVRGRRARPPGKNRLGAWLARDFGGAQRARFLHSRRVSEYSGADAASRFRSIVFCHSSRTLCPHEGNPADYRRFGFHHVESGTVS